MGQKYLYKNYSFQITKLKIDNTSRQLWEKKNIALKLRRNTNPNSERIQLSYQQPKKITIHKKK